MLSERSKGAGILHILSGCRSGVWVLRTEVRGAAGDFFGIYSSLLAVRPEGCGSSERTESDLVEPEFSGVTQ